MQKTLIMVNLNRNSKEVSYAILIIQQAKNFEISVHCTLEWLWRMYGYAHVPIDFHGIDTLVLGMTECKQDWFIYKTGPFVYLFV